MNPRSLATCLLALGIVSLASMPVQAMPPGSAPESEIGAAKPPPPNMELMRTSTRKLANGVIVRTFSGRAAPLGIMIDPRTAREVHIYDYFPNKHDPFGINAGLELGESGYELKTIDRALSGIIPSAADAPWALNMIPFGVASDGSMIDPSGPWYDGGAADPNNPFDRNCTGWEYEVLHPVVRQLVGMPDAAPGHVQSGGLFHYHGYPELLIANLRAKTPASLQSSGAMAVGFSADGYPIIDYVIGAATPQQGPALFLFSAYVLREGARSALERTNPAYTPSCKYDGLYVQDYVFDPNRKAAQIEDALAARGEYEGMRADDVRAGRAAYVLLDERNGYVLRGPRQTLKGYPAAHYAYVLTPDWPQVPRMFAFEPDESFRQIIPFETMQGPAGRKTLYDNCPSQLRDVHVWEGRSPH
jgi:hypothetical protein